MPPVIVIPIPGHPSANSYASAAEANNYHDALTDPGVWATASVPDKNRALVHATRLLDAHVVWVGRRATTEQALAWPRAFAVDRDGLVINASVVPQAVKHAAAEWARRLLEMRDTGGGGGDDMMAALERLKAGPVEIAFKKDAVIDREAIPEDVFTLVAHLSRRYRTGGITSAPVLRS